MTPNFQIIEARARHAGQISRQLRREHQAALMRLGVGVHRQIRDTFDQSYFRRAWMIDGRLSAIGGVVGSELSPVGFVWLALTDAATRYPKQIVREARRQLDGIMVTKIELTTTIADGDEAALRLATFLGFHVEDVGLGAPGFSYFGRRRLIRHIKSSPELLQPLGRGMGFRMGYHAIPEHLT